MTYWRIDTGLSRGIDGRDPFGSLALAPNPGLAGARRRLRYRNLEPDRHNLLHLTCNHGGETENVLFRQYR